MSIRSISYPFNVFAADETSRQAICKSLEPVASVRPEKDTAKISVQPDSANPIPLSFLAQLPGARLFNSSYIQGLDKMVREERAEMQAAAAKAGSKGGASGRGVFGAVKTGP